MVLTLAIMLALSGPIAPASLCAELTAHITSLERDASARAASTGLGPGGSPGATIDDVAALAEIQANVTQLAAGQCAPYPYPISRRAYLQAARQCQQAIGNAVRDASNAEGVRPSCERSRWTRDK